MLSLCRTLVLAASEPTSLWFRDWGLGHRVKGLRLGFRDQGLGAGDNCLIKASRSFFPGCGVPRPLNSSIEA